LVGVKDLKVVILIAAMRREVAAVEIPPKMRMAVIMDDCKARGMPKRL
jgi:hypothetical protein